MKWAALIPLIGGQVIGSQEAIGNPPEAILSYSAFWGNDQLIARYMPDVPFKTLDDGTDPGSGYRMVASTCPCAGLSTFSSAKTGSDVREAKNQWMKDTSKFVLGQLKPDVYLGENAPALFTDMGRSVSDYMIDVARENGYAVTFYKTSTFMHGIPQRRPRTFYHFWKGGRAPIMTFYQRPMPEVSAYLSEVSGMDSETFGDLSKDSTYQYLRGAYGDSWRNGGGSDCFDSLDLMMKIQRLRDFVSSWEGDKDGSYRTCKRRVEKLEGNIYSSMPTFAKDGAYPSCIAKYADKFVHPVEDRFLNIREIAWLMGLPKDFELPSIKSFNAICQNVPVPTARDITYDAIDFINGEIELSDHDVLWFDNLTKTVYYGPEKSKNPGSHAVETSFDSIFE